MTIHQRQIGPFNLSAVVLGCMNLNHAYGIAPPEEEAGKLLNHALDLGVNMLDTAALYGFGKNEPLLAKYVGHRREEYILASKCVLDVYDGERGLNGHPDAIAGTLDRALKRLNTDHIDLYYLHRLDKNVPVEESVGALARAKEAGKIGHIGLSEMSAATIRRAHAEHPVAMIQSEYSPCVRNPEIAVLDLCAELDIGFLAFSPTARGFLADAVHDADYEKGDIRSFMPRFVEPDLSHNLKAAARFNALAADIGLPPAQLAIAWVLARRPFIGALPGTRSIAHLEEDIGAAAVTLSAETIATVEEIFSGDAISGPRYSAAMQKHIDTETFADEQLA
ncbi:aldo/keto reductase [Sphingorhabdus sp. SMR4y]|uniref:aldo/keto reductase n=1 Tax=Sphingorhabdus sp. SMR4y TaxID=2584094 RepID=UPI000B5C43E2|nr:aldo/keto reductase [Sphingorhabdus sp. SMR4y]ASK89723.1 2,5-didehydrogluconate reductase B [Sphingorhabdus sp. SMR4y]